MPNHDNPMTKRAALEMLGGDATTAARAIGCSPQAVRQWPPVLSPRLADRVLAAVYRMEQAAKLERMKRWARDQEERGRNPEASKV
jgi:hypothetical protein